MPDLSTRLVPTMLALLLASALPACVGRDEARVATSLEAYASGAPTGPQAPRPATQRPAAAALVRLPPALARASGVAERQEAGARVQDIALVTAEADEPNRILLATGAGPAVAKPTEAAIRAEIAEAFPGEPARVVATPRHNGFGPYGLVVVAGPGERRCLYAWQWLSGADRRVAGRLGPGDAIWRARLCRRDMTLDAMAEAFDRLDLGAVAPAAAVDRPRRTADQTPSRQATARASQPEPRPPRNQPIADGARYLAPVTALPAPAQASAAPPPARLDPSLPAEAYRGPTAGVAVRRLAGVPAAPPPTE